MSDLMITHARSNTRFLPIGLDTVKNSLTSFYWASRGKGRPDNSRDHTVNRGTVERGLTDLLATALRRPGKSRDAVNIIGMCYVTVPSTMT